MKKLIPLLIFLASCGSSSESAANTNKITATYVRVVIVDCGNDLCISQEDALRSFDSAVAYYKSQMNRDVYLSGVEIISDPEPNKFMDINTFWKHDYRFDLLKKHLDKLNIKANTAKPESFLIFDKYLLDNNLRYSAGRSALCGVYKDSAYSVVYATNTPDERLKRRMRGVAAHEYLHWLGASHNDFDGDNVMNSDIADKDVLNMPPAASTLREVNQCISRRAFLMARYCKAKAKPKRCKQKYGLRNDEYVKEVFGEGVK